MNRVTLWHRHKGGLRFSGLQFGHGLFHCESLLHLVRTALEIFPVSQDSGIEPKQSGTADDPFLFQGIRNIPACSIPWHVYGSSPMKSYPVKAIEIYPSQDKGNHHKYQGHQGIELFLLSWEGRKFLFPVRVGFFFLIFHTAPLSG